MFDNEQMHLRYRMSRAAQKALKHLQAARLEALAGEGLKDHPRMRALEYEIHKGEAFAEESIILSDITVATTCEHVGVSFGTFVGAQFMMSEPASARSDEWARLAFESVYGCMVLHDIACHADLHMQNLAVRAASTSPRRFSILYVASSKGQADSFVFPASSQRQAMIIDFSRSIINPRLQEEIATEQGSEQAAALFREQAYEVLAAVERWLPGFARANQEAVKGAALAHPQRAYEAICFVDYIAVARDFLEAAKTSADLGFTPELVEACERLERSAQRELMRRLKQLIAGQDVTPERAAAVELLHELAPQWHFSVSKARELPLANAYYAEAPMAYSGRDPATYPLWAQPDELLRYTPGKKITEVLDRGPEALYQAIRERIEGDEELALDIERTRARLSSAPPPDAGGSWLV